MSWVQIALTVDRSATALVEAALEGAGALAVTLEDAGDDPLLEPAPGTQPLWAGVRIVGLFEDDAAGRLQAESLARSLGHLCATAPVLETLADRVWERVWLDEFRPTRFGRRLWVCPQGEAAPDPAAVVVDLDPGLAFGTGHHPTTALCLEWLDGADLLGKSVLDYGCGSGILAVAALKLGAARALAVDHDPQAIEATRDNAARNGVADRLAVCLPPDLGAFGAYLPADTVVANILAGPLVELAPTLLAAMADGGDLVLSGLLEKQVPTVAAAYGDRLVLAPPRTREDWALIWGSGRPARTARHADRNAPTAPAPSAREDQCR